MIAKLFKHFFSKKRKDKTPQIRIDQGEIYLSSEFITLKQRSKAVKTIKKACSILIIGGILLALFYVGKMSWPFLLPPKASLPTVSYTIFPAKSTINIKEDGFTPATLLIKKGSSVKWVNLDSAAHKIVSDPHPIHDQLPDLISPTLSSTGSAFIYNFNKTGTFTYHDERNLFKLKGTIIVE